MALGGRRFLRKANSKSSLNLMHIYFCIFLQARSSATAALRASTATATTASASTASDPPATGTADTTNEEEEGRKFGRQVV